MSLLPLSKRKKLSKIITRFLAQGARLPFAEIKKTEEGTNLLGKQESRILFRTCYMAISIRHLNRDVK